MENENEINAKIMEVTLKIQDEHPELVEFLNEMPVTVPNKNKPEINTKQLEDYYDSLVNMVEHIETSLPTNPRPDADRPLDAPMLQFDLPSVIERLKKEGGWVAGKQKAITLMKSESMSLVMIILDTAGEMKMHQADGPISVMIVEGKLTFTTEEKSVTLQKGQLLTLEANLKHRLQAEEETVVLLTIVHNGKNT